MKGQEMAIKAEGVSKCYRIGCRQEFRTNLSQVALNILRKPFSNYRKYRSLYNFEDLDSKTETNDILWALRDVSFQIATGEKVGIIGQNGAGKSTLLKVLSRITYPIQGCVTIHGRISSLLEVGTGFHPELTGRENIYLNGTVLGMKKREIDKKFDEIVEFSGVEQFLDTPVKRYSSGMRIRLAFSVAAHLEPEILIIDEVLAVGDSEFQNKCLHKMDDIGRSGRTILFVSHNMGAITQLCERVLWVDGGTIKRDGPARDVVTAYLEAGTENHSIWTRPESNEKYSDVEVMAACIIESRSEQPTKIVAFSGAFEIRVMYEVKKPVRGMHIITRITDLQGNIVFASWDTDTTEWKARAREAGHYISVCQVSSRLLKPGRYTITVGFHIQNMNEWRYYDNILTFSISGVGYIFDKDREGLITPELKWSVSMVEEKADIVAYARSFKSIAAIK